MTSLALVAPAETQPAVLEVLARVADLHAILTQPELDVADVVGVSQRAEVLVAAARAARLGLDTANEAAELKLRAERRCGAMLHQLMVDAGPSTTRRSRAKNVPDGDKYGDAPIARQSVPPGKLKELAITTKQSSAWQLIARLPEPEFEQRIRALKEARRQLHSGLFVRAAQQFARPVRGRPTTATASLLRRALLLLKEITTIRTSNEQQLAIAVVGITESWDLVLPTAEAQAPTSWTRDTTCLLCGRAQPAGRPPRCPSCGGAWLVI